MKLLYIRSFSLIVSVFLILFLLFSFKDYPGGNEYVIPETPCVGCLIFKPEQLLQLECKPSDFKTLIGQKRNEIEHIPYGTKFVPVTEIIKEDYNKNLYIFLDKKDVVKRVDCL